MTKILLDLPKKTLSSLDALAHEMKVSRTSLIRKAIEAQQRLLAKKNFHESKAFGMLKNNKIDGVKLQRKLRKEW